MAWWSTYLQEEGHLAFPTFNRPYVSACDMQFGNDPAVRGAVPLYFHTYSIPARLDLRTWSNRWLGVTPNAVKAATYVETKFCGLGQTITLRPRVPSVVLCTAEASRPF